MKILVILMVCITLISLASATSIINFYVSDNGIDVIGVSDESLSLPSGLIQEKSKIYGTADLIEKQNGAFVFNFSTDKEIEMNVYLPENAEIVEGEGYISFHDDKIIVSRTGREIYFEYIISSNYYWIGILIILTIVLLLVYFLFFRKPKTGEKKKVFDRLRVIKDTLNERELKIITKLREYEKNNVKIKQNQLRKALGIPKASFSRHIQELEKKKIVKRIGEGKNKFVELS